MQSLVVKISNPDTVHAIAEAAKRQGTTPEAAALELLETAVLAQKPFEEIVEPTSGVAQTRPYVVTSKPANEK